MEVNEKEYTVAHIVSLIRRRNLKYADEKGQRKLIIANNSDTVNEDIADVDIDRLDVKSITELTPIQLYHYNTIYFVYDDDYNDRSEFKKNISELAKFLSYIPFYTKLYVFTKSEHYEISKSDAQDRIETINEINEILDDSRSDNHFDVQEADWQEFWLSPELNK